MSLNNKNKKIFLFGILLSFLVISFYVTKTVVAAPPATPPTVDIERGLKDVLLTNPDATSYTGNIIIDKTVKAKDICSKTGNCMTLSQTPDSYKIIEIKAVTPYVSCPANWTTLGWMNSKTVGWGTWYATEYSQKCYKEKINVLEISALPSTSINCPIGWSQIATTTYYGGSGLFCERTVSGVGAVSGCYVSPAVSVSPRSLTSGGDTYCASILNNGRLASNSDLINAAANGRLQGSGYAITTASSTQSTGSGESNYRYCGYRTYYMETWQSSLYNESATLSWAFTYKYHDPMDSGFGWTCAGVPEPSTVTANYWCCNY